MKTTLQILTGARELLSDPKRWARGEFALDANGRPVITPTNRRAVCFCAAGAIMRASGEDDEEHPAIGVLLSAIPPERRCRHGHFQCVNTVACFNDDADSTTHADVLAAFDRAIALASHSQTTEGK